MNTTVKTYLRRQSIQRKIGLVLGYAVLIFLSAIFLIPFLWSLSASLKSLLQVYAIPPVWIPKPFHWDNYVKIFKLLPLLRFFWNTLVITTLALIGQVFSASLVAYAFARLRWPLRDFFFFILLSTMMLPTQVTLIPQFMLYQYLGWMDTYLPLIVPHFLGISAFSIFLLRQFFKSIPLELEEAARIDGSSFFRTFWTIILPLSKPALATIVILTFIGKWNEFMPPLIYLQTFEKFPISLGINMFKDVYMSLPHYIMATSMVALVPILVLFFVAQKYFVKGIMLSGLKG
ncbi:MAG: carbohydrate ABC transporter permease [Calditrichaeota bacterium]|nr:carbohydrate ABC transporter permease [Calditrichota bacterium]